MSHKSSFNRDRTNHSATQILSKDPRFFELINIFQTANFAIEELDSRNLYRTLNLVKEQKNELQDMLDNAEEQKSILEEIHDRAESAYLAFQNLPLIEKVKFAFADMTRGSLHFTRRYITQI